MVNSLRLSEMINNRFRAEFGYLANPREHPVALKRIIETCTDYLEEEANNHDYDLEHAETD